jgi:5-methylthioadenosine/S-adenosylhomocysteine deaminase
VTSQVRGRVVVTGAAAPPGRDAVIEFDGGQITAVRPAAPGDRGPVHDVVLPGLIDAHSHARGVPLADHGVGDGPLERFLLELRALTPLPPAAEALVAGSAALATGITSMQVFYHSFGAAPQYADGALATARGLAAAGVRAALALGLTDQDEFIPGSAPGPGLDELSPSREVPPGAFTSLAAGLLSPAGLVRIDAVGPVAPQWCSDHALAAISQVPGQPRVHAHLLETARQRLAPGDQVARLAQAGLLTEATSLAHCVWPDESQIAQIAAAGAVVVHCPGSNARLAGRGAPVRQLLAAGIPVALGLDSHGAAPEPDVFAEMRCALRVAAAAGQPLTAAQALGLATAGGASALGRPDLGTLRPGAAADIVALRLPSALKAADPVAHIIAAASPQQVSATWVAGKRTRPARSAAQARAGLAAALAADAGPRAARVAAVRAAWEAADAIWRQLETTGTVST